MPSPVFDPRDNNQENFEWALQVAEEEHVRTLLNEVLRKTLDDDSDLYLVRRGTDPVLVSVGESREEFKISPEEAIGICTRLKVMAGLDFQQTHVNQSGTAELSISGNKMRVQVSFYPMFLGEEMKLEMIRSPKAA